MLSIFNHSHMKRLSPIYSILVALFCAIISFQAYGWQNPLMLPGLEDRSLGDPYIMKYRGYYYLYVSAGDENIYCWKTKDLVNWSQPYICCTDETTSVAYAPEVIYWNGIFYMCTSPRGGGHYFLTSDSPTGPFTHMTDNLGRDIDGSMFVDDDGKWYFYHANNQGIRGCRMPTHLSLDEDIDLKCCISGQWTEGPCVFKRNDIYYMLYTGNHVWTNGYRIDYAMSGSNPLEGFHPQKTQNPILVDTDTPTHRALGHGTAFIGPDLDTYYFCYHNLQDNKARRLLNFERIAWDGDRLIMTGPSCWEQNEPAVAIADYFDRNHLGADWNIVSGEDWYIANRDYLIQDEMTGNRRIIFNPCDYNDYTAEFTIRADSSLSGQTGAVFSYRDAENFAEALINIADKTFEVNNYSNNRLITSQSYALPDDFNPYSWHSVRIEKEFDTARIYIDGMHKSTLHLPATSGRIGYTTHNCSANFSYIAISPYVNGSGILEAAFPVPGIIPAALYTEKEGNANLEKYSLPDIGTANYIQSKSKSYLLYSANIHTTGLYTLGVTYNAADTVKVRVLCDGIIVKDLFIPPSLDNSKSVFITTALELAGGYHTLGFETTGDIDLYEFNFKRGIDKGRTMEDSFNNEICSDWGYIEGDWDIVKGRLVSLGRYGKMLLGGYDDIPMTDYTVECDIFYSHGDTNGGILFRVTNPSTGGADDNPILGTDFLQGYYFCADKTSAILGKHNFGWQPLASTVLALDLNVPHHLKVQVKGSHICCYIDDMDTPVITYTDNNPFIIGRAGLRTHDAVIEFDNFRIEPE